MGVMIGDLVQFKQEKTHNRKCWKDFPKTHDHIRSWKPLLSMLNIEKLHHMNWMAHFPEWRPTETEKIPMILSDFRTECFTASKLPFIRKALTKTLAKVTVFRREGEFRTVPVIFWVLADDIEEFSDKTYLEEFKVKLKHNLSEQKNPHE